MLIGDYYKEKVLSLPRKDRRRFELPLNSGVTRIESEFFGWKLYYLILGRKSESYIECRSEEEARFLKVFMELEVPEIFVPKNDQLLADILPKIEELKRKTDEVLGGFLSALMLRKHRERLKFMVYREVMGVKIKA